MKNSFGNWQKMTLGQVCRIQTRQIQPEDFTKFDFYVGLENIERDTGKIEYQNVREADLKSSKFEFDKESILFGKLRPYLKKVARATFRGICSTDILPLKPDQEKVNKDYLYYFLKTPFVTSFVTEKSIGANLPRISPKILLKLEVPIPELKTQERIAKVLNNSQKLVEKREQANQLAKELIPAFFFELFGQLEFEKVELSSISSEIYRYPTYYGIKYFDCGVKEVRGELIQDDGKIQGVFRFISEETSSRYQRTVLHEGDLVMSVRGTIGKIGIVTRELEGANITR